MSGQDVTFSVVVPVYNNAESIERLLMVLGGVVDELAAPTEVVFVVDGSPDDSRARLESRLPGVAFPTQLVQHSRNFGSFAAIRTGLSRARGRYIGVMAADLQEPPELMVEFLRALASGVADVVVGRREGRADPALTRRTSALYWRTYRRFVIPEMPPGGVDVFGLNREAASQLLSLKESSSSLVGQLFWIGFRRLEIPYRRQARQEGVSGWTMAKKVRYLSDSVYSFTSLPISFVTWLGAVGLVVTLLLSAFTFGAWLLGWVTEPGYTTLMLVLLASTFLVVLSLGIVGNYVWRTYENSKGRPVAIVLDSQSYNGHD